MRRTLTCFRLGETPWWRMRFIARRHFGPTQLPDAFEGIR